MEPKEVKIPLTLLMIGIAVFFCYGFIEGGASGAASVLASKGRELLLSLAAAIIACFIAGWLLNIDFGLLLTAILKLAAIFMFPWAVALVPVVGWLISIVLYWALLEKFFDLDARELFTCVILIFLARFYVNIFRIILQNT